MRILFVLLVLVFATNSWAVDGYKGWKFGTPKAQIVRDLEERCVDMSAFSELDYLGCIGWEFGGQPTNAFFYFPNGTFHRFVVMFSSEQMEEVVKGVIGKFGEASRKPSKEEMALVEIAPSLAHLVWGFDDDTVLISLREDKDGKPNYLLIYSSKDFDTLINAAKSKSIEGDL